MCKISVFGLGYVGCVGIGCLSHLGHSVIGCDIDAGKVNRINDGVPTIVERDIGDFIAEGKKKGLISATTSTEKAILNTSISLICVGTPNSPEGNLDLSFVFSAVHNIASVLKLKSEYHTIVVRSTVPPGTNERICSFIENETGKKAGVDFGVVSNPEFLREGKAVQDFLTPPITVIGSSQKKSVEAVRNIYEPLQADIIEVDPKVAEIIKFVNNSYHALKVTFANEIGAICKALSIDSHQVMNLFCRDTQLNISPVYFKPGFAYGGSCLPKDLMGLRALARDNNLTVPVLESIDVSNKGQIKRAVNFICEKKVHRVGIIGLTFKSGTDDLRNSAAVLLAEALIAKGMNLQIYDRYLNLAKESGTNQELIVGKLSSLNLNVVPTIKEILESSELVVITVANPEVTALIPSYPNVRFFDLARLKNESVMKVSNYEGFSW